jgi:MFS family permease
MSDTGNPAAQASNKSTFPYGWVILAVCTLMTTVTYGLMYSYGVFFKPLAAHFDWDRATVSAVYSVSLIMRGAISIWIGWLADRHGARIIMLFCGFMMGLGLVLTSQISQLWQFFISYSLIEAIGLSGTFGIATAMTARWFTRNRGFALGIVSAGIGVGTLFIVPGSERLIKAVEWPKAFLISGLVAAVIMMIAALFLKPAPSNGNAVSGQNGSVRGRFAINQGATAELTLGQAVRSRPMLIMMASFMAMIFCTQMLIVHLYNYATDIGLDPLLAAGLVSLVGVMSISGRLIMGAWAEKLGIYNALIICCVLFIVSMTGLAVFHSVWALFVFAVIFGFAYGGETPQVPLFVGKFGGTKNMAALVGLTLFVGNIGGALGPWVGGKVYDLTSGYQWAFAIGVVAGLVALTLALVLKKENR